MSWFTNPEGKALLKSGDHCDYTITCGGHEFKVHKIIIASKSKFFKVCTDGNFKVRPLCYSRTPISNLAKESNGVLDLPEQEPRILARALMYMYTGDYKEETISDVWPALKRDSHDEEVDHKAVMEDAIKLYKFADALALPDLSQQVLQNLIVSPPVPKETCCDKDGWGCNCPPDQERVERNKLKTASLFMDLLNLVYEELPNDDNVRARVMVAALESTRALPWPMDTAWDADWNDPPTGNDDTSEVSDANDLRRQLSKFLKETDLVAWNVARHYRHVIETILYRHAKEVTELRLDQRNVEWLSSDECRIFENVGRGLTPDYRRE